MKRALIVAAMGILASTGWAVSANAQADINSNLYPANGGAPAAQRGWEWEVARGNSAANRVPSGRVVTSYRRSLARVLVTVRQASAALRRGPQPINAS